MQLCVIFVTYHRVQSSVSYRLSIKLRAHCFIEALVQAMLDGCFIIFSRPILYHVWEISVSSMCLNLKICAAMWEILFYFCIIGGVTVSVDSRDCMPLNSHVVLLYVIML